MNHSTGSGCSRRIFLASGAAAAISACSPQTGDRGSGLPDRGSVFIRNAYVMTMDAAGDLAGADIHISNGQIAAVGPKLSVANAEIIDGEGFIVLPGLIDTHWHMWNTLLRSLAGDTPDRGYFAMSPGVGRHFTPADTYQGTRLATAEAIHSGITFVHDWSHNMRGPEFADQNLRALRESGLRGRMSYGTAQGQPATETVNLPDIERLHRDWKSLSNDGLLSLGLAWRAGVTDLARKEHGFARQLGLPISTHTAINGPGQIQPLAAAGLLGKDVQLIHAVTASAEEIAAMAETGTAVSLSPFTELRTGFGFPKTSEFLEAGVRVGLSVDTTGLSGNADMFSIMKLIQNVENGKALSEYKLPARRVLELATIQGARSMGVDDRIGSITASKRADLILVSTRALNMAIFSDPAHLIVEAAQPANVDTVIVDGLILKRAGKLTSIDEATVIREAGAAFQAVRKRANW
ncbi:MAG: amidohydrolase family protein [Acidobacteriota bacterium]